MLMYDGGTDEESVQCLPDVVVSDRGSSDRVKQINVRHSTKHEISISDYESEIKTIHATCEAIIKSICTETKNMIDEISRRIENEHLSDISVLENFTAMSQFTNIWDKVVADTTEINSEVDVMIHELINVCERDRSNRVKEKMTIYYEIIKDHGVWDEVKLQNYLDQELSHINIIQLKNFHHYHSLASKLKNDAVERMLKNRRIWEQQALIWRDNLVKERVSIITKMVVSNEFLNPANTVEKNRHTILLFEETDKKIIQLYGQILQGIPYNLSGLSSISQKIAKLLEEKERAKVDYIATASKTFDHLIDELEQKIVQMREFLYKEASCSEEQFMKTFSKYIGKGSDSYEQLISTKMTNDNEELNNAQQAMYDVHSNMMKFLNGIYDTWRGNTDAVNSIQDRLKDQLKECRVTHNNKMKLAEFAIRKHYDKIPVIPTEIMLDRLQLKIDKHLKQLGEQSMILYEEISAIVESYPEEWAKHFDKYEVKMLKCVGLVPVDGISLETSNYSKQTHNTNYQLNNRSVNSKLLCAHQSKDGASSTSTTVVSTLSGFSNGASELLAEGDVSRSFESITPSDINEATVSKDTSHGNVRSEGFTTNDGHILTEYQRTSGTGLSGTTCPSIVQSENISEILSEKLSTQDSQSSQLNRSEADVIVFGQRNYREMNAEDILPLVQNIDNLCHKQLVYELCNNLVLKAREVIFAYVTSTHKASAGVCNDMVAKITKEMTEEKELQHDFLHPRRDLIVTMMDTRKQQLNVFVETFEVFCEDSIEFEKRLIDMEKEFVERVDGLIFSVEKEIESKCDLQLSVEISCALTEHYKKFLTHLTEQEQKLTSMAQDCTNGIDQELLKMDLKEAKFVEYAQSGSYNFGESSKLFNEFIDIIERIKMQAIQSKRSVRQLENSKLKKLNTLVTSYKVHYKHVLLDLYFIEMKSSFLSRLRVKIKGIVIEGDTDFHQIRNSLKTLKSLKRKADRNDNVSLDDIVTNFFEVYQTSKKVINFLNYRCSAIAVPEAQSLDELNDQYQLFSNEDATVTDTVNLTRDIINITSCTTKAQGDIKHARMRDSTDDNWVVERASVEKKYIMGQIYCVYGVGANILDIQNSPWANACKTLTQAVPTSFWLSKNPEGLMALQDLKEKQGNNKNSKQPDSRNSDVASRNSDGSKSNSSATISNASGSTSSEKSKILNLTNKIKSAVRANVLKNKLALIPESDKQTDNDSTSLGVDSSSIPKIVTVSGKSSATSTNMNDLDGSRKSHSAVSDTSSLPAIKTSNLGIKRIKSLEPRKDSSNQMNLKKALNLSKTVGLLTRNTSVSSRKRSSYFQRQNNTPIYDFLVMDEEELRKFVFEPVNFFSLSKKRNFIADELSKDIVSFVEKVKLYFFNMEEDFIVSCITFYRQKHINIKLKDKMASDSDSAIEGFITDLRKYMDEVSDSCDKNIARVKVILGSAYKIFSSFPALLFKNAFNEAHIHLVKFFESRTCFYKITYENSSRKRKLLMTQIRPNLSHPNQEAVLNDLKVTEKEYRVGQVLAQEFDDIMNNLLERKVAFDETVCIIADQLEKIVDFTIQSEDIRKITSVDRSIFEVKKRLRTNLLTTTSDTKSNKNPLKLVNYNKFKCTKNKLSDLIQEEKMDTLNSFTDLCDRHVEELRSLHETTQRDDRDWTHYWTSTIEEVEKKYDIS